MMIWLSATLPINSYFVDGFQTGDDYMYRKGNRLADETNTDDDTYFTHRGKIDIFNFSRKPGGEFEELRGEFLLGNNVKQIVVTNTYTGNKMCGKTAIKDGSSGGSTTPGNNGTSTNTEENDSGSMLTNILITVLTLLLLL